MALCKDIMFYGTHCTYTFPVGLLRLRPEDVREGVVRLNPGGDGATIRSIDPGAYSETIFGGGI